MRYCSTEEPRVGGGGSWRRLPRVKIDEILLNSTFKRNLKRNFT
jgi:hypothetical protein